MSLPKKNNYKISTEQLKNAVKNSTSIAEVFRKLKLCNTGTAYRTLKRRFVELEIDTSHFTGQGYLKNKTHTWAIKESLDKILIEHSTYVSTSNLKKRLIKEEMLKNECYLCGNKAEWCGKPLSLQLDHINGIGDDNRIANLRLLCPNCHSQTETFAGKNKKYKEHGASGGN